MSPTDISGAAPPRYAHRLRALGLLRATLVLGAVYDLAFALQMLFAPELPERLLHLPQPGEFFYLGIMALFLMMLASMYLLAARDPRRYAGVIVVAIVGRLAGAVLFAAVAWREPSLQGLYVLAGGDLAIALSHALFFRPALT
jgi:hypothetical protein